MRYIFSGIGYGFGNFGIFDSLVGKIVLVCLVTLIIFGIVMLIKTIRNKK
jgi:hypothetical protein